MISHWWSCYATVKCVTHVFRSPNLFRYLIAHDIVRDMSTFVRLCLIVPWIIQIFHKIDDRTFRFAIIQIPDFVLYLYIRISKYRYFRARTTLYHLDYSHRRSNDSTVHAFLRNFLQIYCSISGFATGMNPVSCVTCHTVHVMPIRLDLVSGHLTFNSL